jgi:hypothetical protein
MRDVVDEMLEDQSPKALVADGFDDAILGVAQRCGQPSLVAYSVAKILEILVERDGLSREDALDHLAFNIVGAWMGPGTPIFVRDDM